MNRKMLLMALTLAGAVIALPFSAAFAASPIFAVSGLINSHLDPNWNTAPVLIRYVGQARFIYLRTASEWVADASGGISGLTRGDQTWTIINEEQDNEHIIVNATVVFETATVGGRTGGMIVELFKISWPNNPSESHGYWRIMHASGDLEGLQGGGDWLSSPNRYVGTVHFSKP